jgi:L-lactate dehydrogenase complex protein LldG
MSNSRIEILAAMKTALHKGDQAPIFHNSANAIDLPSMHLNKEQCLEQFILKASNAHATIHQVESIQQAPALVAETLDQNSQLISAQTKLLKSLDWSDTSLTIESDYLLCDEQASITEAFCGIAETGTLVMLSSPESPTSLNFLPQIQFTCLNKQKIIGSYEQAWETIQEHGALPRCINFITGPSCTGDIEQEILWGAHGPKQLHIIIYSE